MSIVGGMPAGGNSYGDGVWIPSDNNVVVASSIDVLNTKGVPMGYVTEITGNMTQAKNLIRHLNAVDAGRPIEIVPGAPEYALTANGFMLYRDPGQGEQDFLFNRLVYGSKNPSTIHSIAAIRDYFDIGVRFSHPSANDRGFILWFRKCMMTNWNLGSWSINNAGNLAVMQSCNMMCLAVEFEKTTGTITPKEPGYATGTTAPV